MLWRIHHNDRSAWRLRFLLGLAGLLLIVAGAGPAQALTVGNRVFANHAVNVRNAPAGALIGARVTNDPGTITDGPVTAVLGSTSYVWWQVNWDTGTDGWSFEGGITQLCCQPSKHRNP